MGMHVLSPTIMDLLKNQVENPDVNRIGLSESLNELARREQYLALEKNDLRFDIGSRYGLLKAQLALSLTGNDREQIMSELLEFFAIQNITDLKK